MRYISVFSGIEAATMAWQHLEWQAVAFSEIEPFPCAVLEHYYPNVPNLGDISKADWSKYYGAVDLVVGGSPCQSFSVAGQREGLGGESGLVREYFRLLREVQPRWFVWENVPGVFSSNKGRDFQFILDQWEQLGYSVAWRVLDAQYFGVAQRRRRVFVIGNLGNWKHPAKVLFEPESLRRDTPPRRKARQAAPGGVENRAYTPSGHGEYVDGVGTLKASGDDLGGGSETLIAKCLTSRATRFNSDDETFILDDQEGSQMSVRTDGKTGTLRAQTHGHEPCVFCLQGNMIGRQDHNGPQGDGINENVSFTLNATDRHAVAPIAFKVRQGKEGGEKGFLGQSDMAFTLSCNQDQSIYCAPIAPAIGASGPPYSRTGNERVETEALAVSNQAVRRLTPIECERLQAFQDNYTNIPGATDSKRYKALGNSMCVNVMRWIGERIQMVEDGKL